MLLLVMCSLRFAICSCDCVMNVLCEAHVPYRPIPCWAFFQGIYLCFCVPPGSVGTWRDMYLALHTIIYHHQPSGEPREHTRQKTALLSPLDSRFNTHTGSDEVSLPSRWFTPSSHLDICSNIKMEQEEIPTYLALARPPQITN